MLSVNKGGIKNPFCVFGMSRLWIETHVCVCTYMYLCTYVCPYIYIYIYVCVFMNKYEYIYTYIYMLMNEYIHKYKCMYIYIYIYNNVHIHIYIYIYIEREREREWVIASADEILLPKDVKWCFNFLDCSLKVKMAPPGLKTHEHFFIFLLLLAPSNSVIVGFRLFLLSFSFLFFTLFSWCETILDLADCSFGFVT